MPDKLYVIEAGKTEKHYWKDLWTYRELLFFLAWKDILIKYKQTVIGVAWALIRPFITMVVFTIIFGSLANLPSDGKVPYAIMVFAATLPWLFFSNAVSEGSNSLLASADMLSKIYFPRIILPASSMIVHFVDFLISFVIFVGLMIWYQFIPDWRIVFLPFFLFLVILTSLGITIWISALNVKFRDFRFIVPFMVQIGMYISPVGFSSSIVPEKWKYLYYLNPMVGVIDGFRWSIYGENITIFWPGLIISILFVLLTLIAGVIYFRKTEKSFADFI